MAVETLKNVTLGTKGRYRLKLDKIIDVFGGECFDISPPLTFDWQGITYYLKDYEPYTRQANYSSAGHVV